jgi:hypothetical protein
MATNSGKMATLSRKSARYCMLIALLSGVTLITTDWSVIISQEGDRMSERVNVYSAERTFERYVEEAKQKSISRPIEWALYQTWSWADENEVSNDGNMDESDQG